MVFIESAEKVSVSELIKKENLKNLTPEIDTDQIYMTIPDVNRPALQLAGFLPSLIPSVCRLSEMWKRRI